MRFYTVETLGLKRSKTPEGFLVCHDAVLARTGQQIYGPGETPIDNGDDVVIVDRQADEVFRPETIASAAGKPLCDEHPADDVTPFNYTELAKGHILNPHQGGGTQDDLLIGDIVVTDPDIIAELESKGGRRELSCGYDAEYEETGRGRGRQKNIVINHVALVESGRCGPRCSVGDRAHQRSTKMAKSKVADLLRRAFRAKDEKELEEIAKDAEEAEGGASGRQDVHIHLEGGGPAGTEVETPDNRRGRDADPETRIAALEEGQKKIMDRLDTMDARDRARDAEREEEEKKRKAEEDKAKDAEKENEGVAENLEEEAEEGKGKDARKARDSSFLTTSFQETVSLAEIIAPGVQLPTYDRAARPRATFEAICALRKRALDTAYATDDGKAVIQSYLGGRTYDAAVKDCSVMRGLFLHVGSVMKARNTDAFKPGPLPNTAEHLGESKMNSPRGYNELSKQIYGTDAR